MWHQQEQKEFIDEEDGGNSEKEREKMKEGVKGTKGGVKRTGSRWHRKAPPPHTQEKDHNPKALVVSWNDLKISAHGSVCVLAAWKLEFGTGIQLCRCERVQHNSYEWV